MRVLTSMVFLISASLGLAKAQALETQAKRDMVALGDKLRAGHNSVHFLGTDAKGSLCELNITSNNESWSYDYVTADHGIDGDGVFNPYWAFMQDGSSTSKNSSHKTEDGFENSVVEVGSTVDQSVARLGVRIDLNNGVIVQGRKIAPKFILGEFLFVRGSKNYFCKLQTQMFDDRSIPLSLLSSLIPSN